MREYLENRIEELEIELSKALKALMDINDFEEGNEKMKEIDALQFAIKELKKALEKC